MIGVARPTRGLEFTESSDSISANLEGVPHRIRRTWDDPIPDSFNKVTEQLLAYPDTEAILFLEEDTVMPVGGLQALIATGAPIAHIWYYLKLGPKNPSYRLTEEGDILWVGLGCTLVQREVFERVPRPWFRTGFATGSVHEGSSCKKKTIRLVSVPGGYGTQDVYFCWVAKGAGFNIAIVENMRADHLVLEALGEQYLNNGCHKIRRVLDRGEDYSARIKQHVL